VFGHDGDQFATGVRQCAVGVTDFLIEDAQGLLVGNRFADSLAPPRSAVNNLLQMD
jgi:hypothetical protein